MIKGWKRGALLLCAIALAGFSPAEARITITPLQEQQIGWGSINKAAVAYIHELPALDYIQNVLITNNKDRLVAYKDDNHRGLRSPHVYMTNRTMVNAYSIPGGHIFVSDALIPAFMSYGYDPQTGNCSGMSKERKFGIFWEIYGHSTIAAAIAHEDAHWERNFIQREVDFMTSQTNRAVEDSLKLKLKVADGQGVVRELDAIGLSDKVFPKTKEFIYKEEYEADKGALTLLDNTELFSPGSLMTISRRMRDTETIGGSKAISHPSGEVRRQIVIDHIKKLSRGRVEVDQQGCMKLDGKLFMGSGYLPKRDDVSAFDRTVYVAGQLAKCVNFGAKRLTAVVDEDTYKRADGMYPIVAVNDKTTKRVVIDKLDVSQYDATALKTGKPTGHSAEMKAAKEIKKFLEKR